MIFSICALLTEPTRIILSTLVEATHITGRSIGSINTPHYIQRAGPEPGPQSGGVRGKVLRTAAAARFPASRRRRATGSSETGESSLWKDLESSFDQFILIFTLPSAKQTP